jgi:BCD family chlorophyll transporter-like MFS transporter
MGPLGAGIAFLLVGAGLHTVQTAGLALATDLAPVPSQPRVVGLMYVMLLVGSIVSAFLFGAYLSEFTPGRLVQVIQAAAVTTLVLNTVSLWKQETRRPMRSAAERSAAPPDFQAAWRAFTQGPGVLRRLAVIALGTMAFGMQDVLLEPYGGQVLGMGVGATTWLTAALAAGGLAGFSLASNVLARGTDATRLSMAGAALGIPAFAAVLLAASTQSIPLFSAGVLLIGFGGGLFSHGTLTLTMNRAPREQTGLALGAWGAVQATAAGVAVALGGLLRDATGWLAAQGHFGTAWSGPVTGYAVVYVIEIALLFATVAVMAALVLRPKAQPLGPGLSVGVE